MKIIVVQLTMCFFIFSLTCLGQEKAEIKNLRKITTYQRDTTYYDDTIQANCETEMLEYDRSGYLLRSLNIKNGEKDSESKYSYTKNGAPLEVIDYLYTGEYAIANFHRYFYDEHDRIMRETFVRYDTLGKPDSSMRIVEYFNVYAPNDSLLSSVRKNEGFETERTTYVYGAKNFRKYVETHKINDVGLISEIWKYNDAGLLVESLYQDSAFDVVYKKISNFFFYDNNGALLKICEGSPTNPYKVNYFSDGHKDSIIYYDGKRKTGGEINSYDKSGKLLSVEYYRETWDADGKLLLALAKEKAKEYTYDANGNLIKFWWNRDAIIFTYRYYYENNLLVKKEDIKWDKVYLTTSYEYEFY